jgi:hypothetical protein
LPQSFKVLADEEEELVVVSLQQLWNPDRAAEIPSEVVDLSSGIVSTLNARA